MNEYRGSKTPTGFYAFGCEPNSKIAKFHSFMGYSMRTENYRYLGSSTIFINIHSFLCFFSHLEFCNSISFLKYILTNLLSILFLFYLLLIRLI